MTITLPGHGHWLVRCLLAVLLAGSVGTPAWSQQADFRPEAVFRGQSPYGWNGYAQSLPVEPMAPFRTASSPWIVNSQETAMAPRVTQAPTDPFGQPYPGDMPGYDGGLPGYGDPNLPGLFMDSPAIWQPYVSAQGKLGSERSVGIGQLMMPLYQDGQSLFFADIRGRIDDADNTEGNFGLAVRTMVDPSWFVGLNGFFDYRRTEYDNSFSQGTIGVEAMSVLYEARLNGYIPEGHAKVANSLSTTEFIGNTIFVKGGFERAYYGVDGEIGGLLWDDGIGSQEIRGFLGGYWFDTNDNTFPSVAGPRGRLEFRAYDLSWFGPESRLTLGVELQHDSVRDFQISGIARLEIPLGFFQSMRKLSRLERRMLDRIVRDDDIITVTNQGPREVGIDSLTKRPLINVALVDANTHNTTPIATAVTNAGANSTVVVNGGAGPIATAASINVLGGQVFRGGGFQVIGSETGATATFGTRPTITNASNAIDTVVMSNNSTVADLNLTGGRHGVFGGAATSVVLVSGNTVTGAFNHGIEFDTLAAASTIQNNILQSSGRDANGNIINAGVDGLRVNVFSGTAQGNVGINNAGRGFGIFTLAGTLHGNTASGNGVFGIGIGTGATGVTETGIVSNNVANNNVEAGLSIVNVANGGTVSGNTADNNGRDAAGNIVDATADGFRFFTTLLGTISGNTATNNADRGFDINSNLGATGRVTGNTATQNFGRGFHFNSTVDAGSVVSGNLASRNGFDAAGNANPAGIDGFVFNGAVSGMIRDNQSENNQQAGYFIENLQAVGSVINNAATNNPFAGFVFNTGVAGTVDKNYATGSTAAANGRGFDFTAAPLAATARVTENISTHNRIGFGFNANAAGAVINGNTAAFNGISADGTVFDATGNGFEWLVANNAIVTNNFALGNANNGFSGVNDANFTNNAAGTFSNNLSNNNGDKGYRFTPAGTAADNKGSGNVNGGDTAP